MKFSKTLCVIIITILVMCVVIALVSDKHFKSKKNNLMIANIVKKNSDEYSSSILKAVIEADHKMAVVYDGLTLDELSAKLDRFLTSNLAGKGSLYATHCMELGIDPYLAVAISMHETGCKWGCSRLVRECNNVGGQKAKPSCNGGSYKAYDTLDEGIIGFLDNIYYNYYQYGLTTPEAMNPRYAADTSWSSYVNKYINQIKSI